jgi:RimJ/RimL family protein N-acetyltransferase
MTLLGLPPESLPDQSGVTLETERLLLRAPRLADAGKIAALANDKRIAENTRRLPHPYTQSDAEDFIASQDAGESVFLIARRDGEILGLCSIAARRNAGPDLAPEIGYWLGVAHWNQGYATEAVRALIDYAFTECGHEALVAGARIENPACRRVLEKCGFQWSGVGLCRIRVLESSAPIDLFRLERGA